MSICLLLSYRRFLLLFESLKDLSIPGFDVVGVEKPDLSVLILVKVHVHAEDLDPSCVLHEISHFVGHPPAELLRLTHPKHLFCFFVHFTPRNVLLHHPCVLFQDPLHVVTPELLKVVLERVRKVSVMLHHRPKRDQKVLAQPHFGFDAGLDALQGGPELRVGPQFEQVDELGVVHHVDLVQGVGVSVLVAVLPLEVLLVEPEDDRVFVKDLLSALLFLRRSFLGRTAQLLFRQ
jgi:hypothetical protein